MNSSLTDYRAVWDQKPVLRMVYGDFFDRIAKHCKPGRTLEIGGGIGNLKELLPDVVSSDIQLSQELDVVADAQSLPVKDKGLANIVMLDVLHHLEFPVRFLREAVRTLEPGGRIVMVEPAITWGSTLFYRFIHHEPVDMSADPLIDGDPDPDRDPYESNQAIPTLMVTRDRNRLAELVPGLQIRHVDWFAFFAYPLSGGFRPWSLVPQRTADRLVRLESHLEKPLGRRLGFRILIVLEKRVR
jgi:SAM-dependent methyltransferase